MSRPLGTQDLLLIGGIFAVVLFCLIVIGLSMPADHKRYRKQRARSLAMRSQSDLPSSGD
jgi:hypothetical protein